MQDSDLYDLFAATATFEEIATQNVVTLWRQVGELRTEAQQRGEPDGIKMTDWEIAEAILEYAQDGLQDIMQAKGWVIERWEHTHWTREDGRRCYRGHFWQEPWPRPHGVMVGVEVNFWARHPVLAMRHIVASGRDPANFAHETVN